MGEGRQFHYPKWVWSSSGGWWVQAANWKRNTVIYFVVSAGLMALIANYAEKKTVNTT